MFEKINKLGAFRCSLQVCIATLAFSSAPSYAQLEEIVVTAQKREQNLQAVPITVTVHTAEQLEQAGVDSMTDLTLATPGLNYSITTVTAQPFIRGVGTDSFAPGTEASVATYVDGVYLSTMASGLFSFNNIDRIEVLKGPQGTLYGRNSTAGLINIITAKPNGETRGNFNVGLGNYDTTEAGGYYTTGLTDKLAADISLTFRDQGDGYYHNQVTGNSITREEGLYLRSKWVYTASDDLELTLIGDYSDYDNTLATIRQPGQGTVAAVPASTYTTEPGQYNASFDPIGAVEQQGFSARVDWDLGSVQLVSISAYREDDVDQYLDGDDSSIRGADIFTTFTHEQVTQEFQLLSNNESGVEWIVGLFYQNSDNAIDPLRVVVGGNDASPALNTSISSTTKAGALYGQASFSLSDATSLTVGGRFNYDEKDHQSALIPGVSSKEDWSEPTWRLALDHTLNDNVLLFSSYSRGYKSGAFNTLTVGPHKAVDPEIVDTFEVGMKADFLDNRLRLNSALFYTIFEDIQVRAQAEDNTTVSITNAARGEIFGLDADLTAAVSDNFTLRAGVSILDATYDMFDRASHFDPNPANIGGNTENFRSAAGNSLIRTPDWTFNLGGEYAFDIGSAGSMVASFNYFITDDIPWDPSGRVTTDGYDVANANLTWTPTASDFQVQIWAKNVFDELYENYVVPSNNDDRFSYAQPRTYGVKLSYQF